MANAVYDAITSKNLNYHQKLNNLCHEAENSLDVLCESDKWKYYYNAGGLCDMNEGNAPYRPRYVMADFEKFVKQGSKFLKIDPPKTLDDLIWGLEILYTYIPSITTKPVYLGNLDKLIDPFIVNMTDEEVLPKLEKFLGYIDRVIANAYSHANIGPEATRAGWLILQLEEKLQLEVPNLSLKYDVNITPDDFAEKAILCSLKCGNPAICNNQAHKDTYIGGYGISSCYNILPIGGGSYTLSRIVLPRLAKMAKDKDDFLNNVLPDACKTLAEYMSSRVKFLVEKSGFFESDFLVQEGLISRDRFIGMYGIAGLCDCVNNLLADKGLRYGHDKEADDLADQIMTTIYNFVHEYPAPYSELGNGHFLLHAQAGLATDIGVTSGVRIIVGDEPENLLDHLRHSARFHRFFPTGCSDIFPFDNTAERNPAGLLDIVKGAFSIGDKYCAFYGASGDMVRITGYLVKKSDLEKYDRGEVVLQDNVINGSSNYKLNRLKDRKVRSV
jgi:YjjI family glycine radical enzyme